MDVVRFVPQSRPRLFFVAVRKDRGTPPGFTVSQPNPLWHPPHLVAAYRKLSQRSKVAWLWWKLPPAPQRHSIFSDLIEDEPEGVVWHTAAETRRLLSMMSQLNRQKVDQARGLGRR